MSVFVSIIPVSGLREYDAMTLSVDRFGITGVKKSMRNQEKLQILYELLGTEQLAELLEVNKRQLNDWLGQAVASAVPEATAWHTAQGLLDELWSSITQPQRARRGAADFSFIDLFAGIGGMRRGFESVGGRCVFASEWDRYAQKTYRANYGGAHPVVGDITKVDAAWIPEHDVLLAGFPCQPFSLAGVSKKNSLGRAHGFACDTQGTLFFEIERIIAARRPQAFLLENVKNLLSHDKGRTFRVITHTLEKQLGYRIFHQVIDANGFVPQHRQRIFIVGFREDVPFSWSDFRHPGKGTVTLANILHPEDGSEPAEPPFTAGERAGVSEKYVISNRLWAYLRDYRRKHAARGNGFGFSLVTPSDTSRTLSARYHKDGSEILIARGTSACGISDSPTNPRRLTPRECARLMGYPDSMQIPVSDTQAYRQLGNSVVVPLVSEVARIMKPHIMALVRCEASPEATRLPRSQSLPKAGGCVSRSFRKSCSEL